MKHTYTLDGTKILRETWDDNVLIPLYDNEDSVCGIVYNDTPYYFLKNLQGDVIAIANQNGQTVVEYDYDAWGVCVVADDMSGDSIEDINPFRYRGYYYDAEIGMYYLQSRYYDPDTSRFINPDEAIFVGTTESHASYNLYAYCDNSPVIGYDPTGYFYIIIAGLIEITITSLFLYLIFLALAAQLTYYALQIIYRVSKMAVELLEELFDTLEYSLTKALTKKQKDTYAVHHIIAQSASAAYPARRIWTTNLKLSVHDYRNKVAINSVFHSHLHRNAYYSVVNRLVEAGYSSKGNTGVLTVVGVIKAILLIMSECFF